jgi:hypothetical protein
MLRPAPQPLEQVCLSFDVGSQNCGICLFDGSPSAQKIMFVTNRPLLDEHQYVIHDVAPVKRHLDEITLLTNTLLNGRPYFVLIEQQFTLYQNDPEAKRQGLVFPLQLESCIAMYYVQRGIEVKTIHATQRYPFLGLHGWKQDSRWQRKQNVVNSVAQLLSTNTPGNQFAYRDHDLSEWEKKPPSQRSDMADAIAQALCYVYRNIQAVYECQPYSPLTTLTQTPTPSTSQQTPVGQPQRQVRRPKPTRAELRGKLELTLSRLGIDFRELLKDEPTNSAKLYKIYKHHPNNKHLLAFLEALDAYNSQKTDIPDVDTLSARLTPLLT